MEFHRDVSPRDRLGMAPSSRRVWQQARSGGSCSNKWLLYWSVKLLSQVGQCKGILSKHLPYLRRFIESFLLTWLGKSYCIPQFLAQEQKNK